jgi:hypothetical protein
VFVMLHNVDLCIFWYSESSERINEDFGYVRIILMISCVVNNILYTCTAINLIFRHQVTTYRRTVEYNE